MNIVRRRRPRNGRGSGPWLGLAGGLGRLHSVDGRGGGKWRVPNSGARGSRLPQPLGSIFFFRPPVLSSAWPQPLPSPSLFPFPSLPLYHSQKWMTSSTVLLVSISVPPTRELPLCVYAALRADQYLQLRRCLAKRPCRDHRQRPYVFQRIVLSSF